MSMMELSQHMDVKMDIKEKVNRSGFKNWTRVLVKVEAIKCFPCYVKVTILRTAPVSSIGTITTTAVADTAGVHDLECTPTIIRITVPGLYLLLAKSRTKDFTYGFFWKANRKRCSIFLAFATDKERTDHMNWVLDSIRHLEQYRQEFLEIRRASRCSTDVKEIPDPFSNYQNLGPAVDLLPHETSDWASRRQSTVSGIYEEIPDVAQGEHKEKYQNIIYERLDKRPTEMRSNSITSMTNQTPPPLPPRQRINTLDKGEDNQSMGSPESETLKKRKYKTVLESIFGLNHNQRRGTLPVGGSECKLNDVPVIHRSDESDNAQSQVATSLLRRNSSSSSRLNKSKRNSFSTPELANWQEKGAATGAAGCEANNDVEDEWEDVSCMSLLSDSMESQMLNISQQIKPNFNLSMNQSSVNLVGCNFNAIRESEIGLPPLCDKRQSMNQVSGYCVMKPIGSIKPADDRLDASHLPPPLPLTAPPPLPAASLRKECSGYCQMGPVGFDKAKVIEVDQIEEESLDTVTKFVVNMTNITLSRGTEVEPDSDMLLTMTSDFEKQFCAEKPTTTATSADLYANCRSATMDSESSNSEKRRSQKFLIDDKTPSYIPNPTVAATSAVPANSSSPPRLMPKQRSRYRTPSPKLQTYSPRAVPNIYSVPRNNSPVLMDSAKDTEKLKQSLTDSISKLSIVTTSPASNQVPFIKDSIRTTPVKGVSPMTPEKRVNYDTISPTNKYLDKCTLKSDFANLKRFASLPRFRKLDLSPLKIKLTNVLQRHNSEY